VSRPDPGRDGQTGSADDTTILVFDQTTTGASQVIVRNDKRLNSDYKGLEITAVKRFSKRWQMVAGYTLGKAEVTATAVQNPNQLINAKGPIAEDRTHIFKLTGQVILPWQIYFSPNLLVWTGQGFTRTLPVSLTQGTVTVNAEPRGSARIDTRKQLDARLAKVFKLNGHKEVEASLDGYNLTNSAYVWDVRTLTPQITLREGGPLNTSGALISQPQFLLPAQIVNPRIFRLGMAFRF
jgi:hypothetical protein